MRCSWISFVYLISVIHEIIAQEPRIVGGYGQDIKHTPYIASIELVMNAHFHVCGGAVISANFVITAAHCVEKRRASQFVVVFGTSNLKKKSMAEQRRVRSIKMHEHYCRKSLQNDIALLRLVSPLRFGATIRPIELEKASHPTEPGTVALVSGWGMTCNASLDKNLLRSVQVTVCSQEECHRSYGSMITEKILCAGVPGKNQGVCSGDSGGPLVANHKLVGIVSFGPLACAQPDQPDAYTRVAAYQSWIERNIRLIRPRRT